MIPKRYRPAVTAAILIIISLVMLSYTVKKPTATGVVRQLVLEMSAPLVGAVNSALAAVGGAWKKYIFLVGLQEENRSLRKRNALLFQELIQYRESYLEGLRLQKLLAVHEPERATVIAARVVDRDEASVFKTILVNRGTAHGIRAGLPVMSDQGLVGRTVESSWHVSRVLLLIDENSNVDALIQRNRVHGILQGSSSGICTLKYVSKTEEINIGDTVVTSGLSDVFPKGLLIGVVSSVNRGEAGLFQRIQVTPSVNFSQLEEVLVMSPHGQSWK